MANAARGGLWRGAIAGEANANYIVNVVGWVFVSFGALSLLQARNALGNPAELAIAVGSFVALAGPAGFLLTRKNRIAAAVLFALNAILLAFSLLGFVYSVIAAPAAGIYLAILPLFWTPLTWLCWRAFKAASFLSALKRHAARSPGAVT